MQNTGSHFPKLHTHRNKRDLILFYVLIFLAVRYVGSYLADQGLNLHPLQWKVKVKVSQSCPTLCNPIDYTAGILNWVSFPFSRGSSQSRHQT